MAKIKSIDQAVVITSELTNEQLVKAQKYFPEILTVKEKNEDGKSTPVFAVAPNGSTEGAVTRNGIQFPKGVGSENAAVTINIPKMSKEKRTEFVKNEFGKVFVYLTSIEKAYADANKAFDEQYKALDKDIIVE